jgi:hypothetical protein
MKNWRLSLAVCVLMLAGCSAADISQPPFTMYVSSQGTFLLNTKTGKVWIYDATEKAFLEVPVAGKIMTVTPEDMKNSK